MDALQISGKWYISSRRAAKENGYHADYLGQLIRSGKVKGQKVGRSWYVSADSLSEYLEKEGSTVPKEILAEAETSAESSPAVKLSKTAASKKVAVKPSRPQVEPEEEAEEVEIAPVKEEKSEAAITEILAEGNVSEERGTPLPQAKIEEQRTGYPLLTYLHEEEPLYPNLHTAQQEDVPKGEYEVPVQVSGRISLRHVNTMPKDPHVQVFSPTTPILQPRSAGIPAVFPVRRRRLLIPLSLIALTTLSVTILGSILVSSTLNVVFK